MREEEEGFAEPSKQALLVCAGAAGMRQYPAPTPCLRPNHPTAGHPLVLTELKLIPTAGILTKGSHGNEALLFKKKKKLFCNIKGLAGYTSFSLTHFHYKQEQLIICIFKMTFANYLDLSKESHHR